MGDNPRRTEMRVIEIVAHAADPDLVLRVADDVCGKWALCAIANPGEEKHLANEYKARGLRLRTTEALFIATTNATSRNWDPRIARVETPEEAFAIGKGAGERQILDKHLGIDDSPCRLYAAYDDGRPVGWVRSIRTHPDADWVSNLYVLNSHRRQGLGTALMSNLLFDDARLGIERSVLLASKTGALVYPQLGYKQIGTLLLMSPKASRP